jgi:hypothetical protein
MTALHQITKEHRELALLVERDELTAEDVKDTFEALEGEVSAKAASLVAVVDNINSDVKAVDDEIKRLQARKKVMVSKQQSLRDYLKMNMQATGISNIKCPLFSITLAKGRDVVVIDDPEQIPNCYKTVTETTAISKAGIMADMKIDIKVPGAHIEKSDESLRIK